MKLGAILPNAGPLTLRLGVKEMATRLIRAGVGSLWVSDHLVLSDAPIHDYPYAPDGHITWNAEDDYLECLTTCAFVAALLQGECTIGTAVLVLPQRNVLQTAKELATLDRLSAGRLAVGLGAGWNQAEMEALGHKYASRGRRFDEMVHVLRDTWSGRTTGFSGSEIAVPAELILNPPPTRREGPPLLIGGMSHPAIRRAARLGDGWLALAFVDRWDERALTSAVDEFHREWRELRGSRRARTVLKLHCPADRSAELSGYVATAASLGFDEVAVELPWARGVDTAVATYSDLARGGA